MVNQYLGGFGVPDVPWLTSPNWVLTGVGIAVDLVGRRVQHGDAAGRPPGHPARAARSRRSIDGANAWPDVLARDLPLLRPALSLVITLLIIGALRVFSQIYIMTNGGPAGASGIGDLLRLRDGCAKYQLGYAAAISMMLFVTILTLTLLQLRSLPGEDVVARSTGGDPGRAAMRDPPAASDRPS